MNTINTRPSLHRNFVLSWTAWLGAGSADSSISQAATAQTNASVISTQVICREPGKYLGEGSEYANANGVQKHAYTVNGSWSRIVISAGPPSPKIAGGELIVAFSGDRDAHVSPRGKPRLFGAMTRAARGRRPKRLRTPRWTIAMGISFKPNAERSSSVGHLVHVDRVQHTTYPTALERYARHAETIYAHARSSA